MAFRCPKDQNNFKKYVKQTRELELGLKNILPLFNTKIGWADIERTLQKIQIHFQNVETPYIYDKPLLFRRLAQCLNPNIEEGVHKTVLEIYDKILSNVSKNGETLMNDLYFITMGLFPYLQVCSNEKKKQIYKILNNYVLPLGVHLGPLIPSLICAICPGLIENNLEIDTEVYKILNQLGAKLPGPYFYGSLWLVLLRSPKSRYGVLKYLNYFLSKKHKAMEPDEQAQSSSNINPQNEFEDHENREVNYNALVNSKLEQLERESLAENSPEKKENAPTANNVDSFVVNSPLKNQDNLNPDLNSKEPHSDAKKNFLGPDNQAISNIEKVDEQPISLANENSGIDFIVSEKKTEGESEPQQTQAEEVQAGDVEREFLAENAANLGEYDLFIQYCKSLWINWNNDFGFCANDVFPNKQMVLTALKSSLVDESPLIRRQTLDFIIAWAWTETGVFNDEETIQILKSCLYLLENNEYSIKRRVLRLLFVFEEEHSDMMPDEKALELTIKALRLIFQKSVLKQETLIFKVLQNMFMDRENIIEPIITALAPEILETLSAYPQDKRTSVGYSFFISIYSYFLIFVDSYTSLPPSRISVSGLKVLTELGKEHLQPNADEELINGIPKAIYDFHTNKCKSALLANYPQIYSELEKNNEIPFELTFVPDLFDFEEDEFSLQDSFIGHLIRIRILRGYFKIIAASPLSSEEALKEVLSLHQNWLDLHYSSEIHSLARQFLENFKASLIPSTIESVNVNAFELALRTGVLLLQKLNDNDLTNQWAAELEKFLQSLEKSLHFCLVAIRGITEFISQEQSEVFKRLNETAIIIAWRLLDDIRFHSATYSLINELGKYQTQLMLGILNAKLADEEIVVRVNHLQRIIIFWKIGNFQQSKDREIQLEDALTCILLDHLENTHPVLRQISKSWLIDSAAFLDRVIDPLIRQLINNCALFGTFSGRIFHANVFNVQKVLETFRRIKFMITNNPSKFGTFALETKITENLKSLLLQQAIPLTAETYSDILITYSIYFLRAGVLPFMGRRFRQDNLLVATAACEMLELIIKTLLSVSPKFLNEELVEMLLRCYYQFVKDESSVMQINMINLMKVILFQSGFLERNNKNLSLFEKIFREKKLLENVIGSIKNNKSSHTLLKIVDFLQTTIEVFSENFFPENKLKDIVSLVFESYHKYITEDFADKTGQESFESMVVLVDASFKLFDTYLNLSAFTIPSDKDKKGSVFFSILTLGLYRGRHNEPAPSNFKLIEAYLLENFDQIMFILLKGWKMCRNPESFYQFFNIGPQSYNDESFLPKKSEPEKKVKNIKLSGNLSRAIATRNSAIINKVLMDKEENNEGEQIKEEIQQIAEKLYYKYKISFVDALLKIWVESYNNVTPTNALVQNKTRVKLMDMMMYLNIDLPELNQIIFESNIYKENRFERKKQKEPKVNWHPSQTDCSILAFYYGFLKHKKKIFIEDKTQRKNSLRTIWNCLFEFLQSFVECSHPQVDLWVVNIYYLAALRYPVQEIISEYSIKKTLHIHENTVLEKIVGFICDEPKFKLTFDKNPLSNSFTFIFPLPAIAVSLTLSDANLYIPKLTGKFDEDFHLRYYTKIISLKFLKIVTIKLLKLTYASQSNDRIARRVYNIVSKLFIYIESLLKNKIPINENLYIEIIEYLFIFLDDSREFLMQALDPLIERFFDSDLFFECPTKSLVLWSKIINWHVNLSAERILSKYLIKPAN